MKKKVAEQRTTKDGSIVVKHADGREEVVFNSHGLLDHTTTENFLDFTRRSYAQYAIDTMSRGIPRVEDGLKLVTRRIVGQVHGTDKNMKSARLVGNVIGTLHPHGDTAVYGALVTVANKAGTPYALGQGNWGNVLENENAAAMRYTEFREHRNLKILWDKESMMSVPEVPNFDGTITEPYFLLLKLPALLLNQTEGITVGYSIKMPAHNIKEVAEACIASIKANYRLTSRKLSGILKGPSHRVYNCKYMIDNEDWLNILETGTGKVISMITYEFKDDEAIVTSLPHGITLDKFLVKADALNEKMNVLTGDPQDLTQNDICRIVFNFKKTSKAGIEQNTLFMQKLAAEAASNVFYKIYTCEQIVEEVPSLSDGASWDLYQNGITNIINTHNALRRKYKMKSLQMIIDGLEFDIEVELFKLEISKDADKFFDILKRATTNDEARDMSVRNYKVRSEVAETVIKNSGFTSFINKDEKIKKELERLRELIKDYKWKMENVDKYMIDELNEVISKIGDDRTSEIITYEREKVD